MEEKLGFIGGGAMAEAIIAGLIAKGTIKGENIFVSDHKKERCVTLEEKYGLHAFVGSEEFLSKVDILILAVKPQVAQIAMEEVAKGLKQDCLFISIVAGLSIEAIEEHLKNIKLVRVMPNTPLAIGQGMSAFALNALAGDKEAGAVEEIFGSCGRVVQVEEKLLDGVTGLSGSGPAYGFLMIEALADGGVAAGLPRKTAILLAAQTLLGAASMVLETGTHPSVLKDQVTSPAGTTIAGLRALEEQGVRGAMMEAVLRATERSRELGKK